ncbi:LLM class flavin-dependent oxidoreductase, partial [Pseudomonas syringae]
PAPPALPRRALVRTPAQPAAALQTWFEAAAADGFIINSVLPDGLQYFTEWVVPVLQRRGLFRTEYSGTTLRENLGLEVPVNRHAKAVAHQSDEAVA